MSRLLLPVVAAFALTAGSVYGIPPAPTDGGSEPTAKPPVPVKLPANADQPVIVYDVHGGFTPPPMNDHPTMRIYADGRVLLGNRFDPNSPKKARLAPEKVKALLDLIINEKKFETITAEGIKKQIAEADKKAAGDGVQIFRPQIADAPSTRITVRTAKVTHSVDYYALGFGGGPGPGGQDNTVADLKRLRSIANHLRDVRQELTGD